VHVMLACIPGWRLLREEFGGA